MSPALTVVGGSAQALVLAAAVSVAGDVEVELVGDGGEGWWTPPCEGPDLRGRARVRRTPQVGDADLVVVVASAVSDVRALYEGHLVGRYGGPVILAPGGVGGALSMAAAHPGEGLAEASGFPVLGSVTDGTVRIAARKDRLPIGSLDATLAASSREALEAILPGAELVDVLVTSMANTNHVVHPALAATNLAHISNGETFRFYREGLSYAGTDLALAVDEERLAITDALGLPRVGITEWFDRFYARQGLAGANLHERLASFEPLADSPGPTLFRHRYIVDDVRFGIAVYERLGSVLGTRTPVISALVTILAEVARLDLRDQAPALAGLLLRHAAGREPTRPGATDEPRLPVAS